MADFKGSRFPKHVILQAVWFHVRFAVPYRDLEEIMAERGTEVDHATLNRWVGKYPEQPEARKRKARPARPIRKNGWPDRVVIDRSGADAAGSETMNLRLLPSRWCRLIEVPQVEYLNRIIG